MSGNYTFKSGTWNRIAKRPHLNLHFYQVVDKEGALCLHLADVEKCLRFVPCESSELIKGFSLLEVGTAYGETL
jgi:hypothetical protein